MATIELERTAKALVDYGKGILAADETPTTLMRRFDALKIDSTPDSRRAYRARPACMSMPMRWRATRPSARSRAWYPSSSLKC